MTKAIDFTLKNTKLEEIKLSDHKGQNVLLLFFPLAFTSTCTKELCDIRDNKAMYDGWEAQIFAISVDAPASLAAFKEAQGYNFPLLSDFNKAVSIQYGVLYPEFAGGLKGVSKRAAFVIDRFGKIRYAEVLENAGELPNFVAIQQLLQTLKD